jgi:hypothetical protein
LPGKGGVNKLVQALMPRGGRVGKTKRGKGGGIGEIIRWGGGVIN